jgi:hypothetical protein
LRRTLLRGDDLARERAALLVSAAGNTSVVDRSWFDAGLPSRHSYRSHRASAEWSQDAEAGLAERKPASERRVRSSTVS